MSMDGKYFVVAMIAMAVVAGCGKREAGQKAESDNAAASSAANSQPAGDAFRIGMSKQDALVTIEKVGYVPHPVQFYPKPTHKGGSDSVYVCRNKNCRRHLLLVRWRKSGDVEILAAFVEVERSGREGSMPPAQVIELLSRPGSTQPTSPLKKCPCAADIVK